MTQAPNTATENSAPLTNSKILVTGATGSVGLPVALAFAKENSVTAIGRFSDSEKQSRLEQAGVECIAIDLLEADFSTLRQDFDYVLHFAVMRIKDDDFDTELKANAEATGLLMQHCQTAKAFLHCSSCAVYHPNGRELLTENSPLGDNHRNMFTTYSVGKNAAEAVARFAARAYKLPTTIARLNVPYGDNILGWPFYHLMMMQHGMAIPVNTDKPSEYRLIHEDDIIRSIPALLKAASYPATIINWSSNETVSIEDWCSYIADQTGLSLNFDYGDNNLPSVVSDNSRFIELAGHTQVSWKEGIQRILAKHYQPR